MGKKKIYLNRPIFTKEKKNFYLVFIFFQLYIFIDKSHSFLINNYPEKLTEIHLCPALCRYYKNNFFFFFVNFNLKFFLLRNMLIKEPILHNFTIKCSNKIIFSMEDFNLRDRISWNLKKNLWKKNKLMRMKNLWN